MRLRFLSLAMFLASVMMCCCSEVAGTEKPESEKPGKEEPPIMQFDFLSLGKKEIGIGEDFTSVSFNIFSTRDWTVSYDDALISIEPSFGPGQVDSQKVTVSLLRPDKWDAYIEDAVFTAGEWHSYLRFKTIVPDYPLPQPGDTLTVVEFNIERGMASDIDNNFDNFVEWVKALDPDILLMCECNNFDDAKMSRLAARWKHPHVTVANSDGWNPAITSKYPIEDIVKYETAMQHGAVQGTILGINFICLHACATYYDALKWYKDEVVDYDGNGKINGFDYRLAELHNIFDHTILADGGKEKDWVFTGDFNAISRTEIQWWDRGDKYWVEHDYIKSMDFWTDVMREQHPGNPLFTYGRNRVWDAESSERLDYFYLSPSLVPCAVETAVLNDDFVAGHSDHRPIVMKLVVK